MEFTRLHSSLCKQTVVLHLYDTSIQKAVTHYAHRQVRFSVQYLGRLTSSTFQFNPSVHVCVWRKQPTARANGQSGAKKMSETRCFSPPQNRSRKIVFTGNRFWSRPEEQTILREIEKTLENATELIYWERSYEHGLLRAISNVGKKYPQRWWALFTGP